ncbi:MAG: NAD(P)-dependent oxidoreductase, partial [Beijerinckiaceae bacterium]
KAFDMHVTGISRSAGPLSLFDVIRPSAELAAAAAEADVVMVSAVAENGSFGLISREVLDSMHSSSILVNIARGSLVDEEALIETLRAGRIAAAAIDVQAQEPVPPEHPLWDLDNLILTPHVAGAGPNTEGVTHASVFAKNLRRWIAGETLDKVVRQT